MRIFNILGVVLVILLPVWIGMSLHDAQSRPQLLGVGSGFTSVTGLSEQDIEKAFGEAKACWVKEVRAGDSWHLASEIAAWVSCAFTTLLTFAAGALGRPTAAPVPTAEESAALIEELRSGKTRAERKRGARWAIVVGVLAASASILTGLGNQFDAPAQTHYQRAAKIHGVILQSRKTLSSTDTTPREANDALEAMADVCIHPD